MVLCLAVGQGLYCVSLLLLGPTALYRYMFPTVVVGILMLPVVIEGLRQRNRPISGSPPGHEHEPVTA
jgi:hypothetical protein